MYDKLEQDVGPYVIPNTRYTINKLCELCTICF